MGVQSPALKKKRKKKKKEHLEEFFNDLSKFYSQAICHKNE
jgi:hypothetical protein